MNFLKRHWFGLITGLFIFCVLVLFVLVLLSPRQDAKNADLFPVPRQWRNGCSPVRKMENLMHAESGIRQQLVRRQSCRRRCQSMGERQAASSVE